MTTLNGSRAEINVTPMIDVLLVLLIILMIIVPQHSTGLDARVPRPSPNVAARTPVERREIVVSVAQDRSLRINTVPVAREDLDPRLRQIMARRPDSVLFVDGAPEVEFQDVAYVLDVARGAGIWRVGLMPRAK